jgi:hypothetical protein
LVIDREEVSGASLVARPIDGDARDVCREMGPPVEAPCRHFREGMMDVEDALRHRFGCPDDTIQEVELWVETITPQERRIFEGRLNGLSFRAIGRQENLSHPTVSSTIRTWTALKEILVERIW